MFKIILVVVLIVALAVAAFAAGVIVGVCEVAAADPSLADFIANRHKGKEHEEQHTKRPIGFGRIWEEEA